MSTNRAGYRIMVFGLASVAALSQDMVQPGMATRGITPEPSVVVASSYTVTFTTGTGKAARAAAATSAGARVRFNYDGADVISITAPNATAVDALRRNPLVLRVTQDMVVRGRPKPGTGGGGGTPYVFSTQQVISTEVQRIGIPDTGNDGTGIGIALLDSGIDFNHPDLKPAANVVATSFNAFTPGASCQDDGGHGTHLSGLIAAQNNSIGILGVAPGATLYCVKVLDSNISGSDTTAMAGLDWVLQNFDKVTPRIRVVNMSFGRPLVAGETLATTPMASMIQSLHSHGIAVVAAAGNDPNVEVSQMVPAGLPQVISVASTVATSGIRTCLLFGLDLPSVPADTASGFTTDGAGISISAPGEERTDVVLLGSSGCVGLQYGTLSTTLGTGGVTRKLVPSLAEARGTSFSTALVTGIVARVMQKQLVPATLNGAEVDKIRDWIRTNASRVGVAPLDHPWANVVYPYTFDGVREGIAQAPQ